MERWLWGKALPVALSWELVYGATSSLQPSAQRSQLPGTTFHSFRSVAPTSSLQRRSR